jgi:assimilatory nitrate reductase catalytic subunit
MALLSLTPETRTHCPFCAFQCGTLVGHHDGKISIAGDDSFPVNRGQMCIKGWSAGELLDHTERIKTPLIRVKGGWQPASWDGALQATADAFLRIARSRGHQALGAFGSGALTNEKAYLLGKFARLALQTPHIDYNGRYCMSSAAAASNRAFGIDRGLPFPASDIPLAETILLIGSNVADTLPPIMQWFEQQKQNGGKLIVVDPRRTPTAKHADLYLPITPGSDLALANGLLFLAIEEKRLNEEYIAQRTRGFEAVRRTVLTYDPVRVERLTGISEHQLRQTVKWLAEAERSLILTGRGPEQQSKGVDSVLAFINLALALGKVGKPGSGYGCLTGQGNGQGGREHGQKADQLPGYRLIENPAAREHIGRVWGIDPARLPGKGRSAFELLDSMGQPEGIFGLLVMGSNVAVASPSARRVRERLDQLDFLVVCDSFLSETTETADVFLPTFQWAEEEGTLTNFEGRVLHRRPAVPPPVGPRSDIDILCDLAERMGEGSYFRFENPREVFEEFRRATAGGIADYAGITYERIDAEDGLFWPCPTEDHPGTPRLFADRFHHADGKAFFHPVEHRPAGEEPDEQYPLYFTTGRLKEHYNSGVQTRLVAPLIEKQPRPCLQVHPRLARQFGIEEGDVVQLESRRGRAEFTAEITNTIRPDTLFAPFHWGGRGAANRLTGTALDPISRMPEFKFSAVRIVTAGDDSSDETK